MYESGWTDNPVYRLQRLMEFIYKIEKQPSTGMSRKHLKQTKMLRKTKTEQKKENQFGADDELSRKKKCCPVADDELTREICI